MHCNVYLWKDINMAAVVIQSKSEKNLKILKELADKLGASFTNIDADQLEDLVLGTLMNKEKTGKEVSRETIMKKLGTA